MPTTTTTTLLLFAFLLSLVAKQRDQSSAAVVSAFSVPETISSSSTSLYAAHHHHHHHHHNHHKSAARTSRRGVLVGGLTAGFLAFTSPQAQAAQDVDYSKIQDLLGASSQFDGQQVYRNPDARPMYLKEPTAEFKENELKSGEFKRKQLAAKKAFSEVLDKLVESDPNDESIMASDLNKLTDMVHDQQGLPLGITKDELVKRIRTRKGRRPKFWPTQVEIAYQDLISEVNYMQSPNKEKDEDNPF